MASPPAPVAPSAPPGVTLERGQTIDRFVVLGLVGRGGMGEVYAAYDPELDRKIAIKLLRARGDAADGRARLLREAQAIAKLSHPNVVVVYDVGTFGESVFIAMEFVEGRTLTGWLQAGQRSRRDVLQVFLAAGRGLAAAHAAGLVHRDFKPDNVMVTNDGQVRVMDFGLARQTGDAPAAPPPPNAGVTSTGAPAAETLDSGFDPDATVNIGKDRRTSPATSGSYLSIKLTQTGAMLGTPAYMAPEQFAMRATDARTDQFSFCVALYESLYGQRPFEGETFLSLMTSVTTGAVRAAPAKTRVPGWMRKVVLRGLETDPERRYPSITALLAALDTDPTVRPKRLAVGAALLIAAAFAVFGARRAIGTHEALCRGGDARWAGIWEANGGSSPRKDAVRRAFEATGRSYAAQAFTSASRLLDDYVRNWLGMYTDACEATHVRGEQSAEVLDLRMACLQERVTSASALSEIFASADATVVENAAAAASALPRLDHCSDVASLRSVVKPPENDEVRAHVEALRPELARLVALGNAGRCNEAVKVAQSLIPRVRDTKYQPLLAETLNRAGFLTNSCLDAAVGVVWLKEAYTTALASRDDEEAAATAIELSGILVDRLEQFTAADEWLSFGRAILRRFDNHPLLDVWLINGEGMIACERGLGAKAVDAFRRAKEGKEKLLGKDDPDVIMALNNLGNALQVDGQDAEALAAFSEAEEKLSRVLGKDHPLGSRLACNKAEVLDDLHRYAEARASFQHALDVWNKEGTDPLLTAYALKGMGVSYLGEGRAAEAVKPLEDSLRLRIENHGGPKLLGETRLALARALWARPAARGRAQELARQSRADLLASGTKASSAALADVDAWLARPTSTL